MAGTRGSSWRPPPPLPPPVPPRTYREHWDVVDGKLRPKVPQRPPPGRVPKLYEQLAFVSVPATGIKSDLHDRAQKAFAMYYIQIDCKNGCGWTVQRRFRELFKFALRIKHIRKSGVDHNVKFPSRFSRKASLSSTLIEQRRRGIEVFLSACVQSVALANPAQNWQDVGRALEELFLMQENYRTSSIDYKPRIPYGSFQVKSTPSGLLIDADAKTLQARALMRHALTRQSRTIELPSANVERRRKLSLSSKSSAKDDPAESVCLKLGRRVAMQQGQVDHFASKMLQIYPVRDLEVVNRRLGEAPTTSLSARPSFRDLFRKKRDLGRRTGSNHITTTPSLSTTSSHVIASRDEVIASPASGRAEELLHRVHRFLTQISWKLVEANPDTVNESKEYGFDADFCFDMTHRLFEAALLERHGDLAERLLFAASACATAFEDDLLVHEKLCDLQKMYRGRGIPPALFGAKAHPQLCTDASCGKELEPGKSFAWGWEEAVEVMNRLNDENLPTAKVETILECVAEIHRGIASSAALTMSIHEEDAKSVSSDGIENAASFHTETKSENTGAMSRLEEDATETLAETTELEELDETAESISPYSTRQTTPFKAPKAVGADDFVPIFIYVIACSNLRQPWTLHKFMSTLASDSLLSTEAKYWLTVFESGLFFLANAEF